MKVATLLFTTDYTNVWLCACGGKFDSKRYWQTPPKCPHCSGGEHAYEYCDYNVLYRDCGIGSRSYSGPQFLDIGYFYCPYIIDPESFKPRNDILTKYSNKLLDEGAKFYASIEVSNFIV